ncbi:hypothetical protein [Amycolatopsis vancoresmycina]|uniref:Transmembrane protein n=1 Tax=Amycolatopsis vancoresmycina DSM 44592 TaxID=1292037 RepID=R1G0L7_9PSEU|nr:hypothetical protein [Amycolatopsis vancoresmycina]EOD65118.1 hypothetical protein H480_28471 [Amycolatopsis vancoresmycina DSM 44592]
MRSRELRFGLGVFVLSLGVLLVRFLVPRPVGMADNGDGWRLLCDLGGRHPELKSEYYVHFSYGPGAACKSDYISSQAWLDWLASKAGTLLGSSAQLNLLVLGAITCVLVAVGVTAAVLALDLSVRNRVIAAVLLLLVMADSAFFGYFASVLSEGAGFLGMLLTAGGLLLMHRTGAWRYWGAALTVVGALIGLNAKSQTLLLIPLFLLALVLVRPLGKRGWARWALPLGVLVLVGAGTAVVQSQGDPANAEYREANMFHVVFDSIVDGKHDTDADLAALGLPPSAKKFIGKGWWEARPWTDADYNAYSDQISRRNVVRYYAGHPKRTLQILQQGAVDTLTARPPRLGSFSETSGLPPMAQEFRVPVFSGLSALVAPLGLVVLVPVWLLTAWAGVRAFRRRAREYGIVVFFLLLFAVGQFGLSALGEGVEGVKHQLLTLFPTCLAFVFAALSLLPRPAPPVEDDVEAEPVTEVFDAFREPERSAFR